MPVSQAQVSAQGPPELSGLQSGCTGHEREVWVVETVLGTGDTGMAGTSPSSRVTSLSQDMKAPLLPSV